MIGVVRKDRCGAPKLFRQHCSRHKVGPCHAAERDQQVCFLSLGVAEAIGAADHQAAFTHSPVAPDGQLIGEFQGGELPAFFIEQQDYRW